MKYAITLISVCALLLGCGCTKDYGNPTTKNYAINGAYDGLSVSHAFEVTMSDGVSDVVVTVGEKAHDLLDIYVKNGVLHIGFKPVTSYNGTAKAVIPTSLIRDLNLSGASSFTGDLSGNEVDVDLSGASIYRGNVVASEFAVDLSGASKAIVAGTDVSKMEIELSGASDLNAEYLETQSVEGDISGASKADVTCCTSLRVNLSGASTLTYGLVSSDCHPTDDCTCTGGSSVRVRW